MENRENEVGDLFQSMVKMGLLSSGSFWIETALQQKNPRLTLDLANSAVLVYDPMDRKLINLKGWN
ncbi:MAG: hypothetical protein ABIH70_01105 [Chloroflexota bacterium]